MNVRSFEDLWIWQESRSLVKNIYQDFGAESKANYDFGFRGQIQRAGVPIMNNIAEGFERSSGAEFSRFLKYSKGSCGEVRSMYYTAEDLQYVTQETANQRRSTARKISAGIRSLITCLENKNSDVR